MPENIQSVLAKSQQLPSIPEVVQELIQSFDKPDVNLDDIAKKIAMDQALSAKVLRLANTAHYSGSRSVSSIKDAVIVLGFNVLRTLVLSCGFVGTFKAPPGFNIKQFWQHSFQSAAICKWLARFARQDGEIAFTTGLLHDIGGLLLHIVLPEETVAVDRTVALGGNRADLESTLLGCNYVEVGSALANQWKFPQNIVDGIRWQLQPHHGDAKVPVFAAIVNMSQYLARAIQAGAKVDQLREHFPRDVALLIGLDVDAVLERMDEVMALDVDIDSLLH